jgi:hypothetical protein
MRRALIGACNRSLDGDVRCRPDAGRGYLSGSPQELAQSIIAVSDPEEIQDRLRELEQLGATVIVLQNNSAANVERAIDVLGGQVLPALRGARV